MAKAFVAALPQIKGIIASMPPPLVGIVSKSGNVRVAYTHEGLMERVLTVGDKEAAKAASNRARG